MALNAKAKGITGEQELAEWLFLKRLVETMPKRNLEQVRSGGIDLVPDNHPFAYEVKRVETITEKMLDGYWHKATLDARRYPDREAVLAYRKNRGDWNFLVSVDALLGVSGTYAIIKSTTFVRYAQKRIANAPESD